MNKIPALLTLILILLVMLTLTLPAKVYSVTLNDLSLEDQPSKNADDDDDEDDSDEDDDDDSDEDDDDDSDEDEDDDSDEDEDDDSDEDDDDDSDEDDDDDSDEDDDDDSDEDDDNDSDEDEDNDSDEDEDEESEVYATPSASAPPGSRMKIEVERSPSGELKLEVKVNGLPDGEYSLSVAGTQRAIVIVGNNEGELEFESLPDDSDELLLNFEILGQLVELKQGDTILFSTIAPSVAVTDDETEIEEDALDGSVESNLSLVSTADAPMGSKVSIQLEKESDGELEFEIRTSGLDVGDYSVVVGGITRGTLAVAEYGNSTQGELSFESDPDSVDELLLDFPVEGEIVQLRDGEIILFSGVASLLVKNPTSEIPANTAYSAVTTKLLPDPEAEALGNGYKRTTTIGVYSDQRFPIVEHCVLGQLEFRYQNGRNLFLSTTLGALQLMRSASDPNKHLFFSYDTGKYFSVSSTLADCTITDPGSIFDEETQTYDSVFPATDDPLGFYNIAFNATQACQIASAETISFIQNGNLGSALEKLADTTFFREIAIKNANRTINAAAIAGTDIEFWTSSANDLISIVNTSLIAAQNSVASVQ